MSHHTIPTDALIQQRDALRRYIAALEDKGQWRTAGDADHLTEARRMLKRVRRELSSRFFQPNLF